MPEELIRFLSWNIKDIKGPDPKAAAEFVLSRMDVPAVICLQEVSAAHLLELRRRARERGFAIESTIDKHRECKDKTTRDCYLATITNLRVAGTSWWRISDTSKRRPETRLAIWFFRKLGLWDDTALFSGALATDIDRNGRPLRVINVHLSQTNWKIRQAEFTTCLDRLFPSAENIICGDFNILRGIWAFVFNVAIGGFPLLFSFWGERKRFDRRLKRFGFLNPLKGRKTSKFGQLDHIVFPDYLHLNRAFVHSDMHGSDHAPVEAELLLVK